jgi:hypothetical protein
MFSFATLFGFTSHTLDIQFFSRDVALQRLYQVALQRLYQVALQRLYQVALQRLYQVAATSLPSYLCSYIVTSIYHSS